MQNMEFDLLAILASGCAPNQDSATYTGRFKIDASTEYAALEVPSSIGGACEGWNTVEIRKPNIPGTGMTNIICWKRNGDQITITDRTGVQQTSGPSSQWSD